VQDGGIVSVIDSTFATPAATGPLARGGRGDAFRTKSSYGHSDHLCGALVGRSEVIEPIRTLSHRLERLWMRSGVDLFAGLKTFAVRWSGRLQRAQLGAVALEQKRCSGSGIRPFEPPDHALAKRQ